MHSPFHVHVPDKHEMSIKVQHVLHDERFWAFLGIIAFTALIVTLAIISDGGESTGSYHMPPYLP